MHKDGIEDRPLPTSWGAILPKGYKKISRTIDYNVTRDVFTT